MFFFVFLLVPLVVLLRLLLVILVVLLRLLSSLSLSSSSSCTVVVRRCSLLLHMSYCSESFSSFTIVVSCIGRRPLSRSSSCSSLSSSCSMASSSFAVCHECRLVVSFLVVVFVHHRRVAHRSSFVEPRFARLRKGLASVIVFHRCCDPGSASGQELSQVEVSPPSQFLCLPSQLLQPLLRHLLLRRCDAQLPNR